MLCYIMSYTGESGSDRAVLAARAAMNSPLLDFPITNATGIIFNVVGGEDMTLQEVNMASQIIYDNADPDATIIFGALVDNKMVNGEVGCCNQFMTLHRQTKITFYDKYTSTSVYINLYLYLYV